MLVFAVITFCGVQVLDGGQNLLEVVDKLTAETAAQEAALQAEKAAEAAALSRIAELEQANLHIEEQYNSVQVLRGLQQASA